MNSKITLLLCFFLFSVSLLSYGQDDAEKIDNLINEGYQLHEAADYQGAIAKYQEAIQLDGKNLLAHAEIAFSYYRLEQYNKSIEHCKKAIKYHKKDERLSTVYVTYGNSLDMIGKTKKSIKIYKEGIKKFPEDFMLYFNYGITLMKKGKKEDALPQFQMSAKLNPLHASSHYLQALTTSELRMQVPSILAGWRFLILEPTGERAKLIRAGVANIMKGNAQRTGKNEITININDFMSKGEKENDFSAINMILGLSGAVDLGEEGIALTEQEIIFNKMETICKMLTEDEEKSKGYYWEYYAPYFSALHKSGHLEAFSHLFLASTNEDVIQNWFEKNGEKIEQFYQWSEAYEW
ncbi:MAG: tetratricopeptide repeat protein [Bacteroidota bacterium]